MHPRSRWTLRELASCEETPERIHIERADGELAAQVEMIIHLRRESTFGAERRRPCTGSIIVGSRRSHQLALRRVSSLIQAGKQLRVGLDIRNMTLCSPWFVTSSLGVAAAAAFARSCAHDNSIKANCIKVNLQP